LEKETRPRFRKAWKYPLFLLGLVILILGELGAYSTGAPANVEAAIGALGLAVLVLSIALG
jgi:hypothetical protein